MPHGLGSIFVGPLVLLFLLAVLSGTALSAVWSRRLEGLLSLGQRAQRSCERDRALPMLWGFSVGVLIFAAAALFVRSHVLALLGILLLFIGVILVSLGLAVMIWTMSAALWKLSGSAISLPWALQWVLTGLLLVSCVPYLGWLLCLCLTAAGTGAVMEALLARN